MPRPATKPSLCAQCRQPLDVAPMRHRPRFCSDRCRQLARTERRLPERPCSECRHPFEPRAGNQVYCSRPCFRAARTRQARKPGTTEELQCRSCGEAFTVTRQLGRFPLYCSDGCRRTAWFGPGRPARIVHHCRGCGEEIAPRQGKGGQRTTWCSEECRARAEQMSPRERGFRCRGCGHTFFRVVRGRAIRRYCDACRPTKQHKPARSLTCVECGEGFIAAGAGNQPHRRFCSPACQLAERTRRMLQRRRSRPLKCAVCKRPFRRGPERCAPTTCGDWDCEAALARRTGKPVPRRPRRVVIAEQRASMLILLRSSLGEVMDPVFGMAVTGAPRERALKRLDAAGKNLHTEVRQLLFLPAGLPSVPVRDIAGMSEAALAQALENCWGRADSYLGMAARTAARDRSESDRWCAGALREVRSLRRLARRLIDVQHDTAQSEFAAAS